MMTVGMAVLVGVAATSGVRGASEVPAWSKPEAASYLARRTSAWLTWGGSARGAGTACISCHTGLPLTLSLAALSRSNSLNVAVTADAQLMGDVRKRVQDWAAIESATGGQNGTAQCFYTDKMPSSLGTESVMNAVALADYDHSRGRVMLGATTRLALEYMWQQQQPNGSWQWLEFGLSPWEHDGVYYGASLAALAVGLAGPHYYHNSSVQPKVSVLKRFLHTGFDKARLHDATVCLLASTYLPGLVTKPERDELVKRLELAENADGGWSLHSLGTVGSQQSQWSNPGTYPSNSVSDGYATGLVIWTLKRLRLPGTAPTIERGIQWLVTHEQHGSWPADYINGLRDPHTMEGRFMRDASSGYAVLALQAR